MKKADRKRSVPLLELAHARSGDKGDTANVGLIALKPEYYPILVKHVTAARVARHFKGMISGPVERYELPNLHALNFLLHGALDGGGDRKSTRLNSSHAETSYAVLCLKQKMLTTMGRACPDAGSMSSRRCCAAAGS